MFREAYRVGNFEEAQKLVGKEVFKYIVENNLYGE
jgi:hypothetical protein